MCCGTCGIMIVHYVKKFPSMEVITCYKEEKKADTLVAILNERASADLPDHPAYVGGNQQLTTEDGLVEIAKHALKEPELP